MYTYTALVTSVYDGDTVTADIDLGFGIWLHSQKLRLLGIDTPEMRGGTVETKRKAREARDFVRAMLLPTEGYDPVIRVETVGKGKYGRWLTRVYIADSTVEEDWTCLNERLISLGHAKPYGRKQASRPAC
jgi:micrococcal nuclease